jgi:ferrous iron transport protein A
LTAAHAQDKGMAQLNLRESWVMGQVSELTEPGEISLLGEAPRGFRGHIHSINVAEGSSNLAGDELERRLIELGVTEGAHVEILHEGAFARDPIAVRINFATVALRRREAMAIMVLTESMP